MVTFSYYITVFNVVSFSLCISLKSCGITDLISYPAMLLVFGFLELILVDIAPSNDKNP